MAKTKIKKEFAAPEIKVGKKAKITVKWKVLPTDYSHEKENEIIRLFAQKYDVPRSNVNVERVYITEKGDEIPAASNVLENIQDPVFQRTMFKKYMLEHNIDDVDFKDIEKIDNEINLVIDYASYNKFCRYKIKWIKWSNFLSFGENNFMDFSKLKGLVLLNGEPANYCGKSTLSYDLLHFLLYGKTSKTDTLPGIFNKYKPEATQVKVEGCLEINGEDYIIRRTLQRPELKRRSEKSKISQKIEYFQIVGGEEKKLSSPTDDDGILNMEAESGTKTSQVIREAIGDEKDFDMIICANSDNLKELISLKDTERGKLLLRWIGLMPLEEKNNIAKDKFLHKIYPAMLLNKYDKNTVLEEKSDIEKWLTNAEKEIKTKEEEQSKSKKKIDEYEETAKKLNNQKQTVNEAFTKIDSVTADANLQRTKEEGVLKHKQKEDKEKERKLLENVSFDSVKYSNKLSEKAQKNAACQRLSKEIQDLTKDKEKFKDLKVCPLCHSKLDSTNPDFTAHINEISKQINDKITERNNIEAEAKAIATEISNMEINRGKVEERNRLDLAISSLNVQLEKLRSQYLSQKTIVDGIKNNKEVIEANNRIDNSLRNNEITLNAERSTYNQLISDISSIKTNFLTNTKELQKRNDMLKTMEEEEKIKHIWNVYLAMVGKDGIGKMVLRTTLPLINEELARMLADVCDFSVSVRIDEKNDVTFIMTSDGVDSPLASGSGFEQTVAALALRVVLGNISTMPRPNFILLDEVLGGVAAENYDRVKMLFDRISQNYSFIFQITHLKDIVDWHDMVVTVVKTDHISKIIDN